MDSGDGRRYWGYVMVGFVLGEIWLEGVGGT